MLVLGLDPGLALTGWALIDGNGSRLVLQGAGVWTTPADHDQGRRLLALWESFGELVASSPPQAVSLERLYFSRNVSTAMAVSQARGVLVCAAARAGIAVHEYTPGEVKQAVTGNGSAPKQQVATLVRMLLGAEVPRRPDDISDACAVGICHQHAASLRLAMARASG
ncbi:MAG TPA: crossover junction endodeoxyribonuclease RuvC [Candidatus Dormibacteraeota bacterium]|nr:crossover junction endodeoxyribonuclease RuvC [Candidatus Dormibacteraeota bacterium]